MKTFQSLKTQVKTVICQDTLNCQDIPICPETPNCTDTLAWPVQVSIYYLILPFSSFLLPIVNFLMPMQIANNQMTKYHFNLLSILMRGLLNRTPFLFLSFPYFLMSIFVSGYNDGNRMNGDIPSVPVTTLSGLASLTQCK